MLGCSTIFAQKEYHGEQARAKSYFVLNRPTLHQRLQAQYNVQWSSYHQGVNGDFNLQSQTGTQSVELMRVL